MTDTITEIKKALEGVNAAFTRVLAESPVDADHFYIGFDIDGKAIRIQLEDMRSVAAALSTLESLQRENEEMKKDRYYLAYAITGGEDAPGLLDSVPTSQLVEIAGNTHRSHSADIDRAMAAESDVKRLRNKVAARALTDKQLAEEIQAIDEACKGGFGEGGGSPGEWWYERSDELEHERKRRELESQLHQHNSRTALSSTGDTHGN